MKRACILLAIITSLVTTSAVNATTQSAKPGAKCPKVGAVQIVSGKKFTCTKFGSKLKWSKGIPTNLSSNAKLPTGTTTVNAQPIEKNSPTATNPSVSKSSDQLNFRGPMVYRIVDGVLERKSDSGDFFSNDSRSVDKFNPIRLRAFEELNKRPRDVEHSNIEIVWDIRESFPSEMIEYSKRQIEDAASKWSYLFLDKVKVKVALVTEKDQQYIVKNLSRFSDMAKNVARFESRQERPFVTGGGGWIRDQNQSYGLVVLGTASYMSTDFMNYEWPQVAAHEFAHVIQEYFLRGGGRTFLNEAEYSKIMPIHLSEGSANTIGYLSAFRNLGWASDAMDWMVWQRVKDNSNWKKIENTEDAIELLRLTEKRTPYESFEMSYAVGALANEFLIAKYGLSKFVELLQATQSKTTYDEALRQSIGKGKEEFYRETAPYILETVNRIAPYG